MTNPLLDPLLLARPVEIELRRDDDQRPSPAARSRKRRASGVSALLVLLVAALVMVPVALADDDDDDGNGGGGTPTTVTLASGPDWGGKLVCLNNLSPPACPPSAMRYEFVGAGWTVFPRPHGSEWIWKTSVTPDTAPAELDTATFSRTITLNGTPTSGEICLAADDYAELRVNNTLVGTVGSTTVVALAAAAQTTFTCFPVAAHLQPGANVIEVFGQNGIGAYAACTNCRYRQHPAGVVFYGQLTFIGGDDDGGDDDDGDDDGGDDDGGSDG